VGQLRYRNVIECCTCSIIPAILVTIHSFPSVPLYSHPLSQKQSSSPSSPDPSLSLPGCRDNLHPKQVILRLASLLFSFQLSGPSHALNHPDNCCVAHFFPFLFPSTFFLLWNPLCCLQPAHLFVIAVSHAWSIRSNFLKFARSGSGAVPVSLVSSRLSPLSSSSLRVGPTTFSLGSQSAGPCRTPHYLHKLVNKPVAPCFPFCYDTTISVFSFPTHLP